MIGSESESRVGIVVSSAAVLCVAIRAARVDAFVDTQACARTSSARSHAATHAAIVSRHPLHVHKKSAICRAPSGSARMNRSTARRSARSAARIGVASKWVSVQLDHSIAHARFVRPSYCCAAVGNRNTCTPPQASRRTCRHCARAQPQPSRVLPCRGTMDHGRRQGGASNRARTDARGRRPRAPRSGVSLVACLRSPRNRKLRINAVRLAIAARSARTNARFDASLALAIAARNSTTRSSCCPDIRNATNSVGAQPPYSDNMRFTNAFPDSGIVGAPLPSTVNRSGKLTA